MPDPFQFHLDLLPHVPDDLAAKLSEIHFALQRFKLVITAQQVFFAARQDCLARRRLQSGKHSEPQTERALRRGIVITECVEALEQAAAAVSRERVLLPGLAALSRSRFLADPSLIQEAAHQWVNDVVVQIVLAHDPSGFALELVSVLWAVEQHGQKQ